MYVEVARKQTSFTVILLMLYFQWLLLPWHCFSEAMLIVECFSDLFLEPYYSDRDVNQSHLET